MRLKEVIYDEERNSVEATWVNEEGINVKVRSYAGEQMDEFVADLESNANQYAVLVQQIRSKVVPPVPQPPIVPYSVTPFQGKAAMYNAGIYNTVLGIINDPATPTLTKLAWQEVTEFTRDSPLLNGLAKHPLINLTDAEIDALFIAAAQIEI